MAWFVARIVVVHACFCSLPRCYSTTPNVLSHRGLLVANMLVRNNECLRTQVFAPSHLSQIPKYTCLCLRTQVFARGQDAEYNGLAPGFMEGPMHQVNGDTGNRTQDTGEWGHRTQVNGDTGHR